MGSQGELYNIHFLDQQTDPGYGQGRPGGRPDNELPGGGGRPDNTLPGMGGRPDNSLPGSGGRPDNSLPGQGRPGIPSNELPDTPPPNVAPGATLVLVRHEGKWNYAVIEPGSPPPKPLPPGSIEHPGNRPPGSQPPHVSGQPVPPTAQPQRR